MYGALLGAFSFVWRDSAGKVPVGSWGFGLGKGGICADMRRGWVKWPIRAGARRTLHSAGGWAWVCVSAHPIGHVAPERNPGKGRLRAASDPSVARPSRCALTGKVKVPLSASLRTAFRHDPEKRGWGMCASTGAVQWDNRPGPVVCVGGAASHSDFSPSVAALMTLTALSRTPCEASATDFVGPL